MMIRNAIIFFILALIAYLLGHFRIAGISMHMVRSFILLCILWVIISQLGSIFPGKKATILLKKYRILK